MAAKIENLAIVPFEWQSSALEQGFYPEDLPEDWRLDYYCGQFRVVFIESSQWLGQSDSAQTLRDELEDYLLESTRLIFKVDWAAQTREQVENTFNQLANEVKDATLAFLVASESDVPPSHLCGCPVTLFSSTLVLPDAWQAECGAAKLSGWPLALVDQIPEDNKQVVTWLQSVLQAWPDDVMVIALQGDAWQASTLTQAQAVAELLGH